MEKILDWLKQSTDFLADKWNGMGDAEMLVAALIVIVITGLIGGIIAKKLRQPLLLGYILAGVFVGIAYKASFGAGANGALESLANIGVALLLFSMGMEFDKRDLKPIRNIAVWGTLSQVTFTLIAGAGIAWCLNRTSGMFKDISAMLIFGAAFVSTSTAVVLKTLTSRGQMGTLSSKVMIGMSIVQDLTVIPIFLIMSKLSTLSDGLMDAVKPLALGAVFMALMMTAGARYLPLILKAVAKTNTKELFLLAVTGIALGAGFLADWMQVSFSFGAFLAGIALSDSEYGKKAISELMPVRDLFAMLFFVSIGMMLDCTFLIQNFWTVLLIMFATSFSRTIFLSVVTWCSGYRNVIPVAMFFGMIPTSEIAFILIQLAQNEGFFSRDAYSLVLCAVVCSMLAGPMMDALTSPVYALLRKTVWKNTGRMDISMPVPELSDHVLIAGGENIGRSIAHLMKALNLPYLLIEPTYGAYRKAAAEKLNCLFGDPQQPVILESAGIERARILLAASSAFAENREVIQQSAKLHPGLPVITRADSTEEAELLREYKVFEIIQPKFEAGLEMTRQALLQLKVSALEIQNFMDNVRFAHYKPLRDGMPEDAVAKSLRSFSGLVELNWIKLPEHCSIAGRSIAESQIRSITGVSVVCIMRQGNPILSNPTPDFVLNEGDIVALIGTRDQCENFERLCGAEMADTPAGAEHVEQAAG